MGWVDIYCYGVLNLVRHCCRRDSLPVYLNTNLLKRDVYFATIFLTDHFIVSLRFSLIGGWYFEMCEYFVRWID